MSKRRQRGDAAQIALLRRMQAADALLRYQEADREEQVRLLAESRALGRVQAAAGEWQAYLSSGVFRPDFASALAGSIFAAEAQAGAAIEARKAAEAHREAARQSYSLARSVEDGAGRLMRKLDRKARQAREERQLAQLENLRGLKEGR